MNISQLLHAKKQPVRPICVNRETTNNNHEAMNEKYNDGTMTNYDGRIVQEDRQQSEHNRMRNDETTNDIQHGPIRLHR